jgi:hypothetical protein
MVVKPRVRSHDPRKLLWLIPGAMVAVLFLIPHLGGAARTSPESLLFQILQLVVGVLLMVGMPLLGIFLLPVDPRLAIASAVLGADLFADGTTGQGGHVHIGLVTLPILLLAVLLTVARQKAVNRRIRV